METSSDVTASKGIMWLRGLFALLLAVIGVFMTVYGFQLALLGGSVYYGATGLALLVNAFLVWRSDRHSAKLYLGILLFTVIWSVWEVGFNFWGLLPRIAGPAVIGLGFFSAFAGYPGRQKCGAPFRGIIVAGTGIFVSAALGAGLYVLRSDIPEDPIFQVGKMAEAPSQMAGGAIEGLSGDWRHYGNDMGGARFSPLDQLTPATVGRLEKAWTLDVGPFPAGAFMSLEVTPLKVGTRIFVCTPNNQVIAADADSGRELWRYDMADEVQPVFDAPCRGVAYAEAPSGNGLCANRILAASKSAVLHAVDAATGKPCPGFGTGGKISLLNGLSDAPAGYYYISSAPQIVRGKIIIGGGVLDGQFYGEPSGVIRAWDVITGKFAWAFDVGRPGKRGEPGEGEVYTPSTPNSWAPISADEKLGLVYLPLGSPIPDYYGGMRRSFDEDFTDAVIALDVETGDLRWRFQTLAHDLWDYDVASQPTLIDMPIGGAVRKALVQPTKRGEIFILDRETGEPLFPVENMQVPQGGIAPGEHLAQVQPFSTGMASFRGPDLREADMWGATPLDQLLCRIKFREARYEGTLTPPGLDQNNLVFPGYLGGIDWGGISIDADRGIMIVNSNRMPVTGRILTRAEAKRRNVGMVGVDEGADPKRGQPQVGVPYAVDVQPFLSPLGMPCNAPPFGLLTGVDLRTGKAIWNKPLGTARDSGPLGMETHIPITMGLPNAGGSITTRGGLTFIAAVQERTFRAFETATGAELWSARLPGGGQATPMTYWSDKSGRQFVVIAAGGNVPLQSRTSTKIVAYALPQQAGD